ncbi:MAG: nuclear transport factor 2 family protein [Gemmatimonadales bacterium]
MDEMTAVRRAVDRLLAGELGPLLDLLAEEVEFELAGAEAEPDSSKECGKRAVADYFTALGGLVAFWQMDYTARGNQVVAWGRESYTVEHCGLEGRCDFALVFDLSAGAITRLQMIEDLRAFMRGGGSLVEAPGDGGWPGWPGLARGRRLAVHT